VRFIFRHRMPRMGPITDPGPGNSFPGATAA
jgi:hypothetical protein